MLLKGPHDNVDIILKWKWIYYVWKCNNYNLQLYCLILDKSNDEFKLFYT